MRKIYLFTWMLLFMGSISFAQNTVLSATVVDSDGTIWANGTWKITFIPAPNNQNISLYNQNGVALTQGVMNQSGVMDNTGHFSITVYDSTTVTPTNSSWTLNICPQASAACGIYNFSTSGPTQDISSALTFIIPSPRFVGIPGSYGYADIEVIQSNAPGATYYSVSLDCPKYFSVVTHTWNCITVTGSGFLPLIGGTLSGSLTAPTFIGALTGHASLDLALSGGVLSGLLTANAGIELGIGQVLVGHATFDLATTGGLMSGNISGSGCVVGTFLKADNTGICGVPPGNGNATAFQGITVSSTAPTNGQIWVFNSGLSQWQPQSSSASLPAASANLQLMATNTSGVGITVTPANTEYNTYLNGNIDYTGVADIGNALNAIIAAAPTNQPYTITLPAGLYKANAAGINLVCTATTCNGLRIRGAGPDATIIQSNCATNSYIMQYTNSTTPGNNFKGIILEDLQLQDTSGTGACADGLLLNQVAASTLNRIKVTNLQGKHYSTGTIVITGSTVTGTGTTFISAMVQGTLQVTVAGVTTRGKICSFTSATSIGLCSTAWATGNIAVGTAYSIAYNGRALSINGGNSYSQYISIHDFQGIGNLECISMYGMPSSGGNSRITIDGGKGGCSGGDGARTTDSMGVVIDKRSDTIDVHIRVNNVSVCGYSESAHANTWDLFECEANATYTPVTTCNGGVATQSCNLAFEISSDANGNGWNNTWISPYAYLIGTVYQFDNATGEFNAQILYDRTLSGTYLTHYYFSGTTGCPGNGSGIPVMLLNWDCNHQLVAQTVN